MLERNRGTENFDLPRRWKKDFDVHDRFEIAQEEPRGNPQRSFDYGTHMGIGSILMSKIIFSATLALACLVATWASAENILHYSNDSRSGAGPGEGGWTQNFNTAKGSASESVSTNKVVKADPDFGRHDFTAFRRRDDADCVFVSTITPNGYRWRPGCK